MTVAEFSLDGVTLEGVVLTLQLSGFLGWLQTALTFVFFLSVCLTVVGVAGIAWSRISNARRVVDVRPDVTAGVE